MKKWSHKWTRVYRGMDPGQILQMNEIREIFLEEIGELAEGFGPGKKEGGGILQNPLCFYCEKPGMAEAEAPGRAV